MVEGKDLVGQILESYGNKIIDGCRKILIQNNKEATGSLVASIRFENIKIFGFNYTFKILMDEHWINVEDGRAAGKKLPPEEPIINWIRDKGLKLDRKGLIGRIKTKGKNKGRPYTREEVQKSASFGIRKSISKFGIKPLPFVSTVISSQLKEDLKREITEALKQEIKLSFELPNRK
jgi:hypothetical protein